MPPATVQIKTNSKFYTIPLLTVDMETISNRIIRDREELRNLNQQVSLILNSINNNSNDLLVLYIQQTGTFPEQVLGGNGGGNGGRDSDREDN